MEEREDLKPGEFERAERIAKAFHEAYEKAAPHFGYKTREASAKPWEEVPLLNKIVMIGTVIELLDQRVIYGPPAESGGDFVTRLGTDGEKWAAEFAKKAGRVGDSYDAAPGGMLHGWFANAIETGRSAGYADAKRESNPKWPEPEPGPPTALIEISRELVQAVGTDSRVLLVTTPGGKLRVPGSTPVKEMPIWMDPRR